MVQNVLMLRFSRMIACWDEDVNLRPRFETLSTFFIKILNGNPLKTTKAEEGKNVTTCDAEKKYFQETSAYLNIPEIVQNNDTKTYENFTQPIVPTSNCF